MARLESGLVNPVLTDEDYQRFERKMDRVFDLVDKPFEGEIRPEGEWHPSNELFAALNIRPVVYAKAKQSAKAIREEAEDGSRPQIGPAPKLQPAQQNEDPEVSVVLRISNDIFDNE